MEWVTQLISSMSRPLKWWVTVATWEQGVLVRGGKKTHHLMPGVHFRIPFWDRVVVVSVRDRVAETDSKTFTTRDGRCLTVGLSLRYNISDARLMAERVSRPETTIRSLALARASEYVADRSSEDIHPNQLKEHLNYHLDFGDWGIGKVEAFVTTFAYSRVVRLLQAHDNGYGSSFDHILDDKPAKVD